jgi:hypothetical protein
MRNEYFRKVPFAWRNVCLEEHLPGGTCLEERMRNEYFRKVPLPGGTFELASTSERFLCLEERSSLRVLPKGSFAWRNVRACEYFRKVPFPSKNHRPAQARTTLCLLLSDHCLFGLHNRCGFKILTVILTV